MFTGIIPHKITFKDGINYDEAYLKPATEIPGWVYAKLTDLYIEYNSPIYYAVFYRPHDADYCVDALINGVYTMFNEKETPQYILELSDYNSDNNPYNATYTLFPEGYNDRLETTE